MTNPNIFTEAVANQFIERINKLTNETPALWGKMNVAQMLAHCCVTYEMIFTDKHPKPKGMMKLILKLFVKKYVTGEGAYKQSLKTAPAFIIVDEREFEAEKERLISYIKRVVELGEKHFDGKASASFGELSKNEWNNMFYKHLDHHLKQFGA